MNLRRVLAASLVLAFANPAFAQQPAPAAKKKEAVKPIDEAKLPEIVAKVNGVDIKKTDLQNAVETMKLQLETIGQAIPPDRKDEVWRGLLDELIGAELLSQEAAARKIGVTEAEVETKLTEYRDRFPSEAVFQNVLKEQGLSEARLKEEIRKQLGVLKLLEREVFTKVGVDDKAAKEYYDKNPDQFSEPEAVRASHVLVKVEKGADEAAKREARKEIEKVLADAKAGKDFAALAREHSDDPGSKNKGGDLNFFFRGQMVPPFEEAAFALQKPGDLSGIVETVYGFHVIKLTEKKTERKLPFDEVKAELGDFLKEKKRSDSLRAYVESLRKKAKVQILI